ncbi:MAG TPA: hypothetical protein PLL30_07575 [Candidatus Krumholzibacteria bacterium]|nr:hypothetical protein [Candidatus Krumholzibacteria bacterium]HPD71615.1 hypothetical protein [Candidatus Krumholzibacteria bacterium]HRY41452.1 hypothetical protein [Candidatus Krumholzibacteria bacterium]
MNVGAGAAATPSFWQVGLALVVVLALLVMVLRLLQRFQNGAKPAGAVRVLAVRRLGPRRDLQFLQVGDLVHTLYRHDGAMVVLGTQPAATWDSCRTRLGEPAAGSGLGPRLQALVAAAGGRSRRRPAA